MPKKKLRDTLARLHQELAAEPTLDAETSALLREILADIEGLLSEGGGAPPEGLAARLADTTSNFESSHPRLVATVGQLADALSGMGI
jgi:hypothetical protein